MKLCPACGKYWENDLTRCQNCGESLPSNEASSEDADEGHFEPSEVAILRDALNSACYHLVVLCDGSCPWRYYRVKVPVPDFCKKGKCERGTTAECVECWEIMYAKMAKENLAVDKEEDSGCNSEIINPS